METFYHLAKIMTSSQRQALVKARQLHISCIIPVLNEAEGIADFLRALHQQVAALSDHFEIIVIDDGSTDQTVAVLESLQAELNLKVVVFSRNFGKANALTAGLAYSKGDVTIIMDADFQHPLELMPTFVEKWIEGFDVVYGIRKDRRGDSFFRRLTSGAFYTLMKWLSKAPILPNVVDYRLLDRRVVAALNQFDERDRFMQGLFSWVGFQRIAIPFIVPQRRAGKSSWKLRKLTGLALTGLISFSEMPLRIWSLIGLIISSAAFIYALYVLLRTLIFGVDLPGFATIVIAIMFFGGIQLMSIGILGEYIGRVFREVKRRPHYLVARQLGFEDTEHDRHD